MRILTQYVLLDTLHHVCLLNLSLQVFEIEEDFDSALDTGDASDGLSFQHRRLSGGSSRRGRPNLNIASPVSPPKLSRPRLDSMVTRGFDGQTYSPLAQIYNPFLVDDDILEEPGQTGSNYNPTSAHSAVSYNPVARRRLAPIQSNVQKRPAMSLNSAIPSQPQGVPLRKFPTTGDKLAASPEPIAMQRSRSTERGTQLAQSFTNYSESEDHHEPDHTLLLKRMDDMEQRQQRIELLLLDISQSLKSPKRE